MLYAMYGVWLGVDGLVTCVPDSIPRIRHHDGQWSRASRVLLEYAIMLPYYDENLRSR